MLLKACWIASSLAVFGCAGLPAKPMLTICQLNTGGGEAYCGLSGGTMGAWVPISNLDRATALLPREWERLKNYIDLLRDYAENRCR